MAASWILVEYQMLGLTRRYDERGLCSYGRRAFLNPPFEPGFVHWFSKLYLKRSAGRTTEAIVLWKPATAMAAWKTLTAISCRVCFPSAYIRFADSSGDSGPGPMFSPALFFVGDRPERFEKAFAGIGAV